MIQAVLPVSMITNIATAYGLDPHLVGAIVMQESRGDNMAVRYEKDWRYLYKPEEFSQALNITKATETMLQSCSWGYCQIMGSVARELGFMQPLQRLCEEDIGLQYGCKQLQKLQAKYPKMQDAISAYNQGSPRKDLAGLYLNVSYVDSVMDHFQALQ